MWSGANSWYTADRCFEIIGYPQGFKKNSNSRKISFNTNADVKMNSNSDSSSSSPSGFTPEQMQKLLNMINDKPSRSIHATMAGRTSFFNGNIIDSGANQHLTGSIVGMFNIVDISELKISVRHPNGTLAIISHVGNLKLSNNVILYDVLVVPSYFVSLLSVNKLIRDSKMFVGFDENKCYIQDLEKEKIVGTDVDTTSDVDHLEFFDSLFPQSLNNDGRDSSVVEGSLPHSKDQIMNDYVLKSLMLSLLLSDPNGVDAMNKEIEALYINNIRPSMILTCCWPLSIEINSSFLYGDLHEDVYMTLPDGYNDENKSKVCVLKYFLGIEIVENDLGLCMSQRKYCLELLYEYGLLAARPTDIPLPKNSVLSFDETTNDKYLSDFTTYQKLVGKLIYLTNTRPDISYDVHCLSQHMHSPLQSYFKASLRVLRYLKGSPGCGIQFYKNSVLKIKAYADADWAKCPNTRRSVTGKHCLAESCEVVSRMSRKLMMRCEVVQVDKMNKANDVFGRAVNGLTESSLEKVD
ncbi:ribonuclease H-like domain-containing protein [Tanacetum coccineum]|uniref:Ribonuclease H-like domain-containing protein n=1 Tax=Tanacetum coccineum TaxID=301880 RepID=A0ABQ4WDQ6_9ASTR